MATFTHTLVTQYNSPSGKVPAVTQSFTGQSSTELTESIAGSTTNQEIDLGFTVASLVAYVISSDQTVTIKTNSTSAPDNTLTITAGVPLVWYSGSPYTNKITVDIVKLFVTNSGGTAANLNIALLRNP